MNLKPEILMVGPMMPQLMAALERDYIVHRLWEAPERDALLKKIGSNVKAIATNGALGASGSLINALPNLEIIALYGAGGIKIDAQCGSPTTPCQRHNRNPLSHGRSCGPKS